MTLSFLFLRNILKIAPAVPKGLLLGIILYKQILLQKGKELFQDTEIKMPTVL